MPYRDPEKLTIPPDGKPDEEQPRWRQDFPIDWGQDEYVSRRDFTKFMALTSLAFAVGQLWILMLNFFRRKGDTGEREIASVDDVPVGGVKVFEYPNKHDACVLVRLDENKFVAYSQKCTHLSCPVIPQPEEGRLHCPCHEGSFDLTTGRPLAGPPRRPLPIVKIKVQGGKVYATGVEERTV
jgi:Rieske Fe-S protein